MRALDLKLLRELRGMAGQALAVALVVAAGVALYVMSVGTLRSLDETRAAYYDRYRFADVFAAAKRAPQHLEPRLAAIPGVAAVSTRVVADVLLRVPGLAEPARGRLVSLPETGRPVLDDLVLLHGRMPRPGHAGEVLAHEAFVEAHGFAPGATVSAVIDGRLRALTIVGVALSPEFVYAIAPGALVPDDARYGVFWMSREALEAATDMDGAFNEVHLGLLRGTGPEPVIDALDRLLDPYGGRGAYTRRDQASHQILDNEFDQLTVMGRTMPPIFLGVAAFLLHVVVGRTIELDRERIGLLKAFGYSDLAVGLHYLKLVLAIVAVGVAAGFAAGVWLGGALTALYADFFRFPFLLYRLHADVFAVAGGVAVATGIVGTAGAVRRAVRLAPAVAMRPAPPAAYRAGLLERSGLLALMTEPGRMIVRHVLRRPVRTALTTLGLALGGAVMVAAMFLGDSARHVIDFHFERNQRQDVTLAFTEPAGPAILHAAAALPGVRRVEPFRVVPVEIGHGPRRRPVGLMALAPDGDMVRLIDAAGRRVAMPPDGLVLGTALADRLDAAAGDTVRVTVKEGRRPTRPVPVARVVEDHFGLGAYMDLAAVARLLGEGPTVSGVHLSVDPARHEALYAALSETPEVAGVTLQTMTKESLDETIAQNIGIMTGFFTLFSGLIAIGVVYNSARVSLSERARELASLRVLGFTRGEVAYVLLGELALLTAVSLPLGALIGTGFGWLMIRGFESEVVRLPLVIQPATYGAAMLVVIAATAVSAAVVKRRIDRLDLIAVLKTRE